MNELDHAPPKTSRLFRFGVRAFLTLLALTCVVGAGLVYLGVSTSLQAERSLHATLFTVAIVDRFVANHDRWPRSWEELEREPTTGMQLSYDWPASSPEIRQQVLIDFAADAATIAAQDPMEFTAIAPIGPRYEYRDGGHLMQLQYTCGRLELCHRIVAWPTLPEPIKAGILAMVNSAGESGRTVASAPAARL